MTRKSGKELPAGFMAAVEDNSQTLWLASFGGGLLKLDREHGVFIRYRNYPENPESITEDRVMSLCGDREGNVWVGLYASEPNFFRTERAPFMPLSYPKQSSQSRRKDRQCCLRRPRPRFVDRDNGSIKSHQSKIWRIHLIPASRTRTVERCNCDHRRSGRWSLDRNLRRGTKPVRSEDWAFQDLSARPRQPIQFEQQHSEPDADRSCGHHVGRNLQWS